MSEVKKSILQVRRYLLTGLLTVIPLWITWLVVDFLLRQLVKFGMPWIRTFSKAIRAESPLFADLLWLSGISRGRAFSKNKYLESILHLLSMFLLSEKSISVNLIVKNINEINRLIFLVLFGV